MANVITIEKNGRDLIINDSISVPKDDLIISKREGFCTLTFPKRYYSEEQKVMTDFLEVSFETCEDPLATDNDDLFEALVKLKRPA